MSRIPLSSTPIDAVALAEILEQYRGQPVMKIVDDFEMKIKEYTGAKYVLALNSGTAAIHLALKALGVGPGDAVIAPTFTYVATINPIIYLGATPVLIDSEPLTWSMDPALVELAIKEKIKEKQKPKCLIVVHGYGMPAQLDEINDLCNKYEIPVLEDAAEAIGSTYKGRVAGTLGKVGIFSFNNNKIVTTYGGGALITESSEIYQKAHFWSNQSRENKPFYEHTDLGFNYRMGPLNAAAGIIGMGKMDYNVIYRRTIYESYKMAMQKVGFDVRPLTEPTFVFSNRWLSTFLFKGLNINDIILKMDRLGIECRRLWNPMHLQPYYNKYPCFGKGFAEELFRQGLCLPSSDLNAVSEVSEALVSLSS